MEVETTNPFRTRRPPRAAALATSLLLLAGAPPAQAQIGDVLRRAGGAVGRVPSLASFLEGEPPITTNLDDAVTEIAWLDGWEPGLLVSLEGMPRDADGRFRLIPGAYAFASESYCLKAGTHGPGGGDGYAYAPLAGPKADIVRTILRGSAARPEIPQRDVQVLLWAIVARTKPSDMPREMKATAARLLTPRQIAALEGGALGQVPDAVMRRAMSELPPIARAAFEAEARIRSMLSSATSSYAELERVAVLAGAPPPDPEGRPVPEGRWSYHPDGYFLRFFPQGYSRTTIHVVVPAAVAVERDPSGGIAAVADPTGVRLAVERDAAGAARAVRLARPDAIEPDVAWDLAPGARADDLEALAAALAASAAPDPVAAGDARRLVIEARMHVHCAAAGSCAAGAATGAGRAGGAGVRRDGPAAFDPSGTVGVPGNRARQRLGQSPRCNGEDPTGEEEGGGEGPDVGQALADGIAASGIAGTTTDHVGVRIDHPGTYWRFSVRLGPGDCPMPQHECIQDAADRGDLPPGSQVGARRLAFGAVHVAGSRVRVNVRIVDVETGVILESHRATVDGNDAAAIAEATAAAWRALELPCERAKGLYDQHTLRPADHASPSR